MLQILGRSFSSPAPYIGDILNVLTVMYWYPITDRQPASAPISMAPNGCNGMFADVPTATPPARVAFCI